MKRSKTQNYTMNLSKDETQGTTWDFPVHQEELKTAKGMASGIHAVVRSDSGIVIGQYRGEKVLPYTDMVDAFDKGLTDGGFSFKRSLMVTANGARFFGRYDVGQSTVAGEKFSNVLRLQSSHDGSMMAGFSFEAERLACFNGMTIMQRVFAMFRKHSTTLDLSFLSDNIVTAVNAGQGHLRETVDRMSALKLDDGQARNILSNIVNMGKARGVSPRAGHVIYDNWRNPSTDEKPLGNTLYRLYNNATRFTRDVEKLGRFEMSRRANLFLTGAMDLAARNKVNFEKLVAVPATALDFDAVTVTQN